MFVVRVMIVAVLGALLPGVTVAQSNSFNTKSQRIGLCYEVELHPQRVVLGERLITISDYFNGKTQSSSDKPNRAGTIIPIGNGTPYRDYDDLISTLRFQALTRKDQDSESGAVALPISNIDKTKFVELNACWIKENDEGLSVHVDRWDTGLMTYSIFYRTSYNSTLENFAIEPTYVRSGEVSVSAIDDLNRAGRHLFTVFVDGPGAIRSRFTTIKGNKRTLEEIMAKAGMQVTFSPANGRAASNEANIYFPTKPHPDAEWKTTNLKVPSEQLLYMDWDYAWDRNLKLSQQLANIVGRTRNIALSVSRTTESQLRLEFIEKQLFGDNPNGDLLLLCELKYGKHSEECIQFR